MHERPTVRMLRAGFRAWPFERGRGWLLGLSRLLLHEPVAYHIGTQMHIESHLVDWQARWSFMCLHEHDASFQHSLRLLPPAAVAIDVGANVGVWSLLAAARHPDVRVHAFEPVPALAARLQRHAALNGIETIVVNAAAVGADDGGATFFVNRCENTGASSLFRRTYPTDEISVPVVTLDTYAARAGIDRVDVLKVDAEGAELLVFTGAKQLLSDANAPIVFFEIDPRLYAFGGTTTSDVKQRLADYGYGIFRWRGGAFAPVGLDDRHGHEDLFALKPPHLAAVGA